MALPLPDLERLIIVLREAGVTRYETPDLSLTLSASGSGNGCLDPADAVVDPMESALRTVALIDHNRGTK